MLISIKHTFIILQKIDLNHLLITIMKNIVKILKIVNKIFFEIVIQRKSDCDEYVDYIENESIEKKVH
jgi:hypothetical protein